MFMVKTNPLTWERNKETNNNPLSSVDQPSTPTFLSALLVHTVITRGGEFESHDLTQVRDLLY